MRTDLSSLDFSKSPDGLLPAIVQHARTGQVLMLGYMNQEALQTTQAEGKVTFYSRSKQRLWTKGESSEHFLYLQSIQADCDGDALLIKALPAGPTCHTGAESCFDLPGTASGSRMDTDFLGYLQKEIIRSRKQSPSGSSYTSSLFARGINKIAQKVGEEAVEVVIEAKDNNDGLFKNEVADLLFHLLILLEQKNIDLDEIIDVLRERHR
jgi:phosphoribosyl-ATP pyrophosphohydrolase/phosphoribosyl-AMP cyclohydrolase